MDEALRARLSRLVAQRNLISPASQAMPYDLVTLRSMESDAHCLRPGERVTVIDDAPQVLVHEQAPGTLHWVDVADVYFLEGHGLVYLPSAWRVEGGGSPQALWTSMGFFQRRILEHGELASIHRHGAAISAVMHEAQEIFAANKCLMDYHGPDHWRRVAMHGISVSRALGVDPMVPYVFGLIHDSHRVDDGYDLGHGRRAAEFVKKRRDTLFSFLNAEQIDDLYRACRFHSDGLRQGSPVVRACWDADRLDLWRVDVQPLPRYMCTDYARRHEVIDRARCVYVGERDKRRQERRARLSPGVC
jgi:uncharacterized protein